MKKFRILKLILVRTHAIDILIGYVAFILAAALIIWLAEPDICTYRDALWYCYAVISTVGFGDVLVTTAVSKVISVVITVYSVFVIAIVTGVVVNFYNQVIQLRQEETLASFLDKLERLPELDPDELRDISEKVTQYNQRKRKRTK